MENSLSSQRSFLKAGKLTTINTSVNQHEGRSLYIWPPQKLLWMAHGSADGVKEKTFFFTIFKTSLLVYAHTTVVNSGPSKVFEQYKWLNKTMKTDTMGIHLVSWFEPKSDGIANKYYLRLMVKTAGVHGIGRNTFTMVWMTIQYCVLPL